MASRILYSLLSIVILLLIMPIGAATAVDKPVFTITASNYLPKVGDEISVIIHADHLQDMFGYEINLAYSPVKWQFVKASSSLGDGFAVPPIVKDSVITFAFTKVGSSTKGVSGSSDLATLTFKSLEAGRSEIDLTRIKTVDKNKTASEVALTARASILVSNTNSIAFKDVPEGHWAKSSIERAAALGIIRGYIDGTFKPSRNVTRAEFVTMLARGLNVASDSTSSELLFKDSDKIGKWAIPFVSIAAAEGWIKGFDDNTFRPNQPITRAEMTTIAARLLKLNTTESGTIAFDDAASIPSWARPYVWAAVNAELVNGRGKNLFVPAAYTSRAEAVTLVLRIVDYLAKG
ncbi:S-layer homology domain-containing protein [Paenibacillus luteus]|uniref:S-layer homology domain-containing protein n=1 Tax=Paenibacillus luteus TaxID=2545753 RepID=UPI0011418AC2|nr:S-layer homology domain-containing protein [Paenibacillus luteus]